MGTCDLQKKKLVKTIDKWIWQHKQKKLVALFLQSEVFPAGISYFFLIEYQCNVKTTAGMS